MLFHRAKDGEVSSSTSDIPAVIPVDTPPIFSGCGPYGEERPSKVMMVNNAHVVKMKAGNVMADTGCKKTFGG